MVSADGHVAKVDVFAQIIAAFSWVIEVKPPRTVIDA